MAPLPGAIGKYRVIRHLGDGGMGAVFLAHDDGIDRKVAIKLLRVDDESLRRRFRTEAQSAGRLKHANIVTVYEYGEFDAGPYLVMEYIEGSTLASLIARLEPPSIADRLGLLIQACQGLAYAHRAGVTHRDIKPSNLMVDRDNVVKIVDFGIARTASRDLTVTGKVVGTPAHMAPEQIQGLPADHRSDIFSMGIVVFELLSGQVAFPGDSDFAIINRIVNGTYNAFTHSNSKLEQLMRPVLAKALARDADRRHQSANELAADLGRVRAQFEPATAAVQADPDSQPTVLLQVRSRRPWWAVAAAVAAAAVGASVWAVWPPTSAVDEGAGLTPPAQSAAESTVVRPEPPASPIAPAAAPPNNTRAIEPEVKRAAAPSVAAKNPVVPVTDAARINTRLAAAKAAEDAGDFGTAVENYQAVLAEQPQNTPATEGLAAVRRLQARARETGVKSQLADAEQKLGDGAYDEAISIFETVLRQDADNAEASSGIARARKAKAAEDALFKSRPKKPPVDP
jgi:serine/threonine-protein kinase